MPDIGAFEYQGTICTDNCSSLGYTCGYHIICGSNISCGICPVGNSYYVSSSTGSDSNDGSLASPFKTIQHAADIVNPGDVVIIRDGIYTDTDNNDIGVYVSRGGTPGNYITFKSENKWKSILDGQNVTGYGFLMGSSVGYVIIEGLEIRNFLDAGININEDNNEVIVSQNNIHDIGRIQTNSTYGLDGIDIGSLATHIQVDRNLIHTIGRLNPNTSPSAPASSCNTTCYNHDHGIYIRGDYINVTNNVFYDYKSGWGVQIYDNAGWKEHINIEDNTFADSNPSRNGQIVIGAYSNDVVIQNNIFYNPTNSMIALIDVCSEGVITNLFIRNNLANVGAVTTDAVCSNYTISNNYLNQDPLFVDAASRNYHLQAGSPAIDAGITIPEVATRF